jgi:acetyl-CoA carboxylase biotin carboxyl carrier protein
MARARRPRHRPAPTPALKRLRELAALVNEHGLAEIEIEQDGVRIRVVRERATPVGPAAGPETPSTRPAPLPLEREGATAAGLVTIESPMVGTFYRAPSPQAPPYVNEGDPIKEGQVLCIIEAMKLMNEIEAKVSGRVARILVDNAQPVEYGQPLFLVAPRA